MRDRSVVLLIDSDFQGHAHRLKPIIENRGFVAAFLDLGSTAKRGLSIHLPEAQVQIGRGKHRLSLSKLRGVWISSRFPAAASLSSDPKFRSFAQDEWQAALGNLYYLTQDLPWVNPLDRDFISGAKLEQLNLARQAGLHIPRTLVTLDPNELRSFLRSCPNGVAIKRLSDRPSLFRASKYRVMLYTHRITEADLSRFDLESIRIAPCHFQEYVPKKSELRVFVVGKRVFPVEIFSQADRQTEIDWRRYPLKKGPDGWEIDYSRWRCAPVELPARVLRSCRIVVRSMGLRYAAIDMIRSKNGEYVFLEANNPGAWAWIERQTGLPISEAIVDILLRDGSPS